MTETNTGVLDFETGLKKHSGDIVFETDKARKMLEEVLNHPFTPFEKSATEKLVQQARLFAGYWFMQNINQRYAYISSELFKLNRRFKHLNERGSNIELETPMIWSVDTGFAGSVEKIAKRVVRYEGYYSGEFELQAEIPTLPIEAQEAYLKALRFNIDLTKRAIDDPLMKKIIIGGKYGNNLLPINSRFKIIWAPEIVQIKEIAPVPKDPALILNYEDDARFLVYKWDAPNERPLEDLLREFTTSFPKPHWKD